ncbi:MAG: esterase [Gammaproteobacteria bacterium]|nr:esterase [Gammaproteobacteria bacterium]
MPGKKPIIVTAVFIVGLFSALYVAGFIPVVDSRLRPSDSPAYIPVSGDSFEFYIKENKQRIRTALTEHFYNKTPNPFGPDYPLEEVVEMRAPFQITPPENACSGTLSGSSKGFLLIHGLSDSPYLLSAVARSLAGAYPCSLIRGLLVPGNGTVPGDLMRVSRDDWERITNFGVEGFKELVDELYVVGYSNGSSLILNYLDQQPDDDFIAGLIFLSPGMKAKSELIYLAPYIRYVMRWVNVNTDLDAAKYESFPMNAAAEFQELTNIITDPHLRPLDIPVFMAMSGDDTTIDAMASAEFFCNKVNNKRRHLLWYRSGNTGASPEITCDGMEVVDVTVAEPRFIGHSHVGITMPMNDPHYGIDGNYSSCLAYSENPALFDECRSDNDNTVYGENTIRDEAGRYQGKLVRRATFNPLYNEMIDEIRCFIDEAC